MEHTRECHDDRLVLSPLCQATKVGQPGDGDVLFLERGASAEEGAASVGYEME